MQFQFGKLQWSGTMNCDIAAQPRQLTITNLVVNGQLSTESYGFFYKIKGGRLRLLKNMTASNPAKMPCEFQSTFENKHTLWNFRAG